MSFSSSAFFYALLAAILGGGMPVAIKIGVSTINPLYFSFLRSLVFAGAIAAAMWVLRPPKPAWHKLPLLLLASLASLLNLLFFAYGIRTVGPALSQVLYLLCPLVVYLCSLVFMDERLNGFRLVGVFVGIAGASTTIISRGEIKGELWGIFLIVLAVLSHSLFLLLSRPLHQSFSGLHQTLVMSLIFCAVFAGLDLACYGAPNLSVPLSWGELLSIFYVGLLGSAAYFLVIQHLVRVHSSVAASSILYLQPAFTAVWSKLFFSEPMNFMFFLGAVLAAVGAWMTNRTSNQG